MAVQRLVVITDDMDGSPDAETTHLMWDGVLYEIDLADHNRAKLSAALQPYIESGRRVGGRAATQRALRSVPVTPTPTPEPAKTARATKAARVKADKAQLQAERTWWVKYWQDAGLPEPSANTKAGRGRIPGAVSTAFQHHKGEAPKMHLRSEDMTTTMGKAMLQAVPAAAFRAPGKTTVTGTVRQRSKATAEV